MNNDQLREAITDDFLKAAKPLTKESAMDLVRIRLQDHPKQLQEFGEWFEKHSEFILERFNK